MIASADSPVGDAVAKRLAGSRPLVLSGTREERLRALLDRCRCGAHLWLHDLADVQDISVSLGRVLRDSNITIGSLVHCAGADVLPEAGDPADPRAFAAPVFSAIELVRTLRRREPNRSALASVVFASCHSGGQPLFAAAQGAIDAFMRSAAVELAGKCRLNCLVSTGSDPAVMAATVEFLLSNAASGISGQRLAVDAVSHHAAHAL